MRQSYSSLQTLQSCERRYAYRYLRNLEKAGPEPLKFVRGHAFHALCQAALLQRGAEKGTLLDRPEKLEIFQGAEGLEIWLDWSDRPRLPDALTGKKRMLSPWAVIERIQIWESQQEGERRDAMVEEFGAPLHVRMAELWDRYRLKWEEEDERQHPLLTEQWWRRTAPNGQELWGRIDAVVYDPATNLVIVRDTKTHDSWPSESDTVLDLMESQNHMNLWGLAPQLRELSGGKYVPSAVEFDRVRTKKPTEPKLTLKGQLSASIKDFDKYTYTNWCNSQPTYEVKVKDPITKETFTEVRGYEYDPGVAAKADADPDSWFRRSLKPLSMNAVTAHVLASQRQAERANALTIEDAGLSPSKACGWCDFSKLCRAEIVGGRDDDFVPADFDLRLRTRLR